jgi:hypothetical protein
VCVTLHYSSTVAAGVIGVTLPCYTVSGSPGMYDSMAERHRYREVLWQAAAAVLGTYALIMAGGYWFYAQFTVSPSKY